MVSNTISDRRREDKRFCACGCGELIRAFDKYNGKPRKIKNGHQNRFFAQQGKYSTPRPWLSGSKNPMWKGGKYMQEGYIKIRVPEHPHEQNGYVFEHRYIMEQYIGRYLTKGEIVHHKNEIRTDNRIENLQLMTISDHKKHHEAELKARNILEMSNRRCIICKTSKSMNNYRHCVCWMTNPITKERWICWTCYQRLWAQRKKAKLATS